MERTLADNSPNPKCIHKRDGAALQTTTPHVPIVAARAKTNQPVDKKRQPTPTTSNIKLVVC